MKKILWFLVMLVLGFVLATSVSGAPRKKCGICERVILYNPTDVPVMHTFKRGSHEGFVIVNPGQELMVDVVWCEE